MKHLPDSIFCDSRDRITALVFILCLFYLSCSPDIPDEIIAEFDKIPEQVDFNIHVKPILSDRCFTCHGPDEAKRKAGLRLDQKDVALAELSENPGKHAIRPGNLSSSQLFHRIISDDPEEMMPPPESDLKLSQSDKAVLIRWIEQGASYKPHWAFLKPQKPDLPDEQHKANTGNNIDHFVLDKLSYLDLFPSEEADKETLLRRLTFDLTGLPPSVQELDAFLHDSDRDGYEKVVDKLMDSPHYGERMATGWMDVARFADTHGYTVDRFRDMSPWRDWVIKAFNDNMPYDQFITWQLAGDLLPDANREQILATGFNRNHQQNMEGGIVPEEFRVEYVADRTNTLGKAFMGLTLECARCHDHKYDPISQKEYYQLFSFFNNVQEAGQISFNNAMPVPTLLLTSMEEEEKINYSRQLIDKHQHALDKERQNVQSSFETWMQSEDKRSRNSGKWPKGLTAHYNFNSDKIANRIAPFQKGEMKQQHVTTDLLPTIAKERDGGALLLDGDAWLDLSDAGVYDRSHPFSVGLWVWIPEELKDGVIFHKGEGAALYNFRGYHVALKDNRLQIMMAHTAPYNAITEYVAAVPRAEWMHLMLTYDGSSTADGLNIYVNGERQRTEVESDNLYKTILFQFDNRPEPGLQIGARWRGIGIRDAMVDDIMAYDRELTKLEILQIVDPEKFEFLLSKSSADLSAVEREELKHYFLSFSDPERRKELVQLAQYRQRHNQLLDTLGEVMIMHEMNPPRQSYILERGQYDVYGDSVSPGTPAIFLSMPESSPKNRLGLAQWLTQADHPLTSRVAVNRLWQQFFGQGLVKTAEDFGNQGELSSHPELLDWLALEFVASGWDIKHVVKMLVMSSTYRQSSRTSLRARDKDPENIYLSRGPSMRLSAEMLRDNALAASGLMKMELGGPSVRPYQPDGLWRINGTTYQQDHGDKLYRCSLYTYWKRTVPHPTQSTFDAPTRSNCTVRRQKTSTPLQALVLLNDPVYVEASKVLGEKISKTESISSGITDVFRSLTGRFPNDRELNLLEELQKTELEKFYKYPTKTKGWLDAGEYILDQNIDRIFLAANTVVANTIINADATIIKR